MTSVHQTDSADASMKPVAIHIAEDNNNSTVENEESPMESSNKQEKSKLLIKLNDHEKPNEPYESQRVSDEAKLEASDTPDRRSSSHNSSGDAMSLRETLQQLPATIPVHHRHRKVLVSGDRNPNTIPNDGLSSLHNGILDFVNNDVKHSSGKFLEANASNYRNTRKRQSLHDLTASPAQRSTRSHSSLEKSPRRKRSRSESKRRRERKIIAAGELEVRQANETLMHYLKQCSDMNDASLSGELEIDENITERKVYSKTKSERSKSGRNGKIYSGGGLSSILRELSDNIVPAESNEIYNPFTPVISPTDDSLRHIDKMFMQTSSGYRQIEHSCSYYKHSLMNSKGNGSNTIDNNARHNLMEHGSCLSGSGTIARSADDSNNTAEIGSNYGLCFTRSHCDTCCLLVDGTCHRYEAASNIELACLTHRIWLFVSNICYGLLAGLALTQLIFVLNSNYADWLKILSLAGETYVTAEQQNLESIQKGQYQDPSINFSLVTNKAILNTMDLASDYITFANIYINTFYCLGILCIVSVLDRMDICRWSLQDATELLSFRLIITLMIQISTIILIICTYALDDKLYFMRNFNATNKSKLLISDSILSLWSTMCITRCIGAICGWCIIGATQHKGFLYDHLNELTSYQIINN